MVAMPSFPQADSVITLCDDWWLLGDCLSRHTKSGNLRAYHPESVSRHYEFNLASSASPWRGCHTSTGSDPVGPGRASCHLCRLS